MKTFILIFAIVTFYSSNSQTGIAAKVNVDGVKLYDTTSSSKKVIKDLVKGANVILLDTNSKLVGLFYYYKVNIDNVKGYVIETYLDLDPNYLTFIHNKKLEYLDSLKNEELKEYIKVWNKNYGITKTKEIVKDIKKKVISIGMTKKMVTLSWGEPTRINRTITSYGVHEQWIYSENTYLYFDDNKLTTIQD